MAALPHNVLWEHTTPLETVTPAPLVAMDSQRAQLVRMLPVTAWLHLVLAKLVLHSSCVPEVREHGESDTQLQIPAIFKLWVVISLCSPLMISSQRVCIQYDIVTPLGKTVTGQSHISDCNSQSAAGWPLTIHHVAMIACSVPRELYAVVTRATGGFLKIVVTMLKCAQINRQIV